MQRSSIHDNYQLPMSLVAVHKVGLKRAACSLGFLIGLLVCNQYERVLADQELLVLTCKALPVSPYTGELLGTGVCR